MTVVMAWKLTFPVMRFAAPASTPPLNGRQSLRLRGRGCRVGRAMLTATLVPQFPQENAATKKEEVPADEEKTVLDRGRWKSSIRVTCASDSPATVSAGNGAP